MSEGAGTKALVTGGGGFLGGSLVKELLARGFEVKSFSRGSYPELEGIGATTVQGDISDPDEVRSALKGVEVVFHTAAKVGFWGSYEEFHRVNVQGTHNVIKACQRNGVGSLVHTSSPSVIFDGKDMEGVDESVPYPKDAGSNYSRTKGEAERLVLKSSSTDLRTLSLRPHLIWGPGDRQLVPKIMEAGRKGRLRVIGDGKKKVDTTYIDNAVLAQVLAFKALQENEASWGRPFFITNGEPRNTWELVNRFLGLEGIPPLKGRVPAGPVYVGAGLMEAFYRALGSKEGPLLTRFLVKELTTSHWFDIGAARRELGYVPRVTIDEGLRRYRQVLSGPVRGPGTPLR